MPRPADMAKGRRAIARSALLGVHAGDESTAPALLVMPERGEAIAQLLVGLEDRTGRISGRHGEEPPPDSIVPSVSQGTLGKWHLPREIPRGK